MNKFIVVTIDGPSGVGKSTVAKLVASKLDFDYLDTGAIYRTIALHVGNLEGDSLIKALDKCNYDVVIENGIKKHYLNGKDVTKEIRSEKISQKASVIATDSRVREVANNLQRKLASNCNIVVEGRDCGSTVFPNADVKVFLTAKVMERAKRRMKELNEGRPNKDQIFNIDRIADEIKERDFRDTERENSPLKRAVDAISINTTNMSVEQVSENIIKLVNKEVATPHFLYKILCLLCRWVFKFLYKMRSYGVENLPQGRAIIAPNHVSFLDPPAIGATSPFKLHSLAQDYLFNIPLLKWIIPHVNAHPVSGSAYDTGVMKIIASLLRKDEKVLIFPEGGRSHNGKLLPLKRGVALLSSMTESPIIPVAIIGAYEIWPRNKRFPKLWGKLSVVYGKPIFWKDYINKYCDKKIAQQQMLNDLAKILQELQANFKRD